MSETASSGGGLIESLVQLSQEFLGVATASPEQALLLLIGAVITGFAAAAFGALALGGVLGAISDLFPSGGAPPQRAR